MPNFFNKYPYTDFHELSLDWILETVKKIAAEWAETLTEWHNTQEEWQQLYDYVHDYFDNLNVQEEVNIKIDQMIEDGTFMEVATPLIVMQITSELPGLVSDQIDSVVADQIGPVVADQIGPAVADNIGTAVVTPVNDWLAANITQPTTPVVDASLSISGAAADAAVTGTRISALESNQYELINLIADNFVNINTYWGPTRFTLTSSSNVLTATSTTSAGNQKIEYVQYTSPNIGHVYYASIEINPNNNSLQCRTYQMDGYSGYTLLDQNTWNRVDTIFTVSTFTDDLAWNVPNVPVGDQVLFRNPILYDLTDIFGSIAGSITTEKMRVITQAGYDSKYITKDLQGDYLTTSVSNSNDKIIVASDNSIYAASADYVLSGTKCQIQLNNIISQTNVHDIYITSDSDIMVDGAIILKSNLKIHSAGAIIESYYGTSSTNTLAVNNGDTSITVTDTFYNNISVGSFIEIFNESYHQAFFVTSINSVTGVITVDDTIDHNYAAGFTVRNVSSVMSCSNSNDITIEGLYITTNYDNNVVNRSLETFYSQNGVYSYKCDKVYINNCNFINGGRHGVLLFDTKNSVIENSYFDTWGEHGIDIFNSNGANVPGSHNNNVINNCVSVNNTYTGIQLHTGSGTMISNCSCKDNGRDGISMIQNSNDNVVVNCLIENNNQRGIWIQGSSFNHTITGCILINNNLSGIQLDTSVHDVNVSNCRMINSVKRSTKNPNGLVLYDASKCVISDNTFDGAYAAEIIKITASSADNFITGNRFDKAGKTADVGVREDAGCDQNIITNNIFRNLTDCILTGINSISANNYSCFTQCFTDCPIFGTVLFCL